MEALSKAELLYLLSAARAHRERDWLMILMGYWHGLRASEVVGITRDDLADGCLTVQRLKGSRKTVQPLVHSDEPLLNERDSVLAFARNLSGKQRLFPITRQTFWAVVQLHGARAGLPQRLRHPHILKHTIAMQTIHSAGIENVRQYLGHKSMGSTGEYLKVSDAEAAASVQKALKVS